MRTDNDEEGEEERRRHAPSLPKTSWRQRLLHVDLGTWILVGGSWVLTLFFLGIVLVMHGARTTLLTLGDVVLLLFTLGSFFLVNVVIVGWKFLDIGDKKVKWILVGSMWVQGNLLSLIIVLMLAAANVISLSWLHPLTPLVGGDEYLLLILGTLLVVNAVIIALYAWGSTIMAWSTRLSVWIVMVPWHYGLKPLFRFFERLISTVHSPPERDPSTGERLVRFKGQLVVASEAEMLARLDVRLEGVLEPGDHVTSPYFGVKQHHVKYLYLDLNLGAIPSSVRNRLKGVVLAGINLAVFTQLKKLTLRNCGLKALPHEVGALRELHLLDVDGNQLTSLPPSIGQLRNLRQLSAEENRLTKLPENLCQLSRLSHLNVAKNRLSQLPDGIGQLSSLKELVLDSNQLTSLPRSIGQLQELETLSLAANRLTALPPSIGRLERLRQLDLEGNRLTRLPEALCQLSRLWYLNVSKNPLKELPHGLHQLTQLETLEAAGTRLRSLPPSLARLKKLKFLDLGDAPLDRTSQQLVRQLATRRSYWGLGGRQLRVQHQCLDDLMHDMVIDPLKGTLYMVGLSPFFDLLLVGDALVVTHKLRVDMCGGGTVVDFLIYLISNMLASLFLMFLIQYFIFEWPIASLDQELARIEVYRTQVEFTHKVFFPLLRAFMIIGKAAVVVDSLSQCRLFLFF